MELDTIRKNKTMISTFIQQVLELIDNGQKISVEEADNALNNHSVHEFLKSNFDLTVLELVDTYDYRLIDTECTIIAPDKLVEPFSKNGLLAIVNYYQWILKML